MLAKVKLKAGRLKRAGLGSALLASALLLCPAGAAAQAGKPITREGLVKAVRITRTNVTFRADDGRDTFEAADSLVKEIKTNKVSGGAFGMLLGGKNIGAFHIKVRFGNDSRNYNFAPLTSKKAEAELIIALVKAYGGVQG